MSTYARRSFVFDVLVHSKEKSLLPAFVTLLQDWVQGDGNVELCKWFLEELCGDKER